MNAPWLKRRQPIAEPATTADHPLHPALADVLAYIAGDVSRGPCVRCGQPVTRRLGETHGFRNGFGELRHLTCPTC
jgi:hypothetical protein